MVDITTAVIIEDIAHHLRTCAIMVADQPTTDFLLRCAHQLDARAKEIREDTRLPRIHATAVEPGKKP